MYSVFNSIQQYSTVFDSIQQYSTVFNSIQQYSTVLNSIEQYSTVFNSIQQYSVFNYVWVFRLLQISGSNDGITELTRTGHKCDKKANKSYCKKKEIMKKRKRKKKRKTDGGKTESLNDFAFFSIYFHLWLGCFFFSVCLCVGVCFDRCHHYGLTSLSWPEKFTMQTDTVNLWQNSIIRLLCFPRHSIRRQRNVKSPCKPPAEVKFE